MSDAAHEKARRVGDAVRGILAGIAPEADLSAVPPDANLRRELDLDSIDFQNFIIRLCKELKLDIPERDAVKLTTLAGCEEYLSGRLESAS